jgi:hypothetical protein
MKSLYYRFIPLILIGVQACGGSDDQASTPTSDTNVVSPDDELAEMVIDINNDLTLDFPLEVSVLLPDNGDERYLTICRYNPELDHVIRDECMFRGPLDDQGVYTTLTVATRDIELAAEVWLYEDGYSPNPYLWQYNSGSEVQSFIVR